MILILSKLAQVLLSPLGLALAAMLLSFVGLAFGRRRTAASVIALAIGGLWIASTPLFAHWLYGQLERRYPPAALSDLPHADAIVVLGGGLADDPVPPATRPRLGVAADRLFLGWRLLQAGKADTVMISGGIAEFSKGSAPEANLSKAILIELGVPSGAVVVENQSRTTHENAVNIAALVKAHGWQSVLLVTSAVHLPRAVASSEHEGVAVTPAAADRRVRPGEGANALDYLPDADALQMTTAATKELIGMAFYRLMGWA